ncbi:MAG: hypothetical protein U0Y68_10270 [Blastocatellia bacterium]
MQKIFDEADGRALLFRVLPQGIHRLQNHCDLAAQYCTRVGWAQYGAQF